MKKSFKKYEKAGLPGGPNELERFTNGFIISERGQWDYPGQPTAVPTPSGKITTEGVEDDLLGIDNLGNTQYMTPNNEYQFEGDMVYEIPQAKKGGSGCPKGQVLINGRCVYVDQPTYADSLALYNNAIAKINFYDKGKNKYKKEKYATTNFKDKKVREELINKLHAAKITTPDDAIKELNKEAKSNKYSKKNSKNRFYKVPGTNLYSFGDILFGEQDAAYHPGSPPILLHKNIRPQGSVSYSRLYDTPNRMFSSTWQDLTDIPYYDPIAIKPGTILTDDEIKKRVPLYGTTGIPIDRLKKLGLNNSPSPCSNPITTVINNVPEKAPFGKKLVGTDEETLPVTGKKCEYVQTINPIYEDIKIEPIELQKSSVRIDNVPLQPLQMHDYTLPDSIEAPQYTLDPYTDDRLSLDVKLPQNKIAALFDRGVIDSKGHIALGKRNKTRLIPRIVQKATGYDPAYFEGYEDEEGNFVPGELDYGNATGSEIEFKGAASLRDLINQKKYEKEYEEYEKKLDEWLKEYEQQNKKQEEGGEFKKGGSKKPSKKYSRSLMAKNRLFAKNPLFKKKKSVKNKIFDPNSPYFQEGGFMEVELDDNEIEEYRRGGYIVEDISVPSLTRMDEGGEKRKKRKNKEKNVEVIDSTEQPITPENIEQVIEKPEVEVNPAQERVPLMMQFSNEFQENNPYDAYYEKAAYDYLKSKKGWNEALGINKSNLPENVAKRIQNNYYKDLEKYVIGKSKSIQKDYMGKFDKKGNWKPLMGKNNTLNPLSKRPTGHGSWDNYGDGSIQLVYPEQLFMGPGAGMLGLAGRAAAKGISNLAKSSLIQGTKAALSQPIANIPGATIGNAIASGFAADAVVNRFPKVPSQIAEGNYSGALENVLFGTLDVAGANMMSPLLKGVAKGVAMTPETISNLAKFVKTEGSPKLKQFFDRPPGPLMIGLGSGTKSTREVPLFKSEIDWVDWVKKNNKNYDAEDIQNVIKNSEEYNIIEQQTKANGTWMKNADGTPFQGTPEQFIQQQSTKFKQAYPEGTEITYRGGDKRDALKSDWSSKSNVVFTTKDEYGARAYNKTLDQPPLVLTEAPPEGISQLYMPKTTNKIVIDGNEYPVGHKYRSHGFPYINDAGKEVYSPGSRTNYARLNAIDQVPANELEAKNLEAFKTWMLEKHPTMTERGFSGEPRMLNDWVMTDHFADFLNSPAGKDIDRVEFQKIIDGTLEPIDVEVHNLNEAQQLKSMFGNSGEFDLTNPNKFKALLPYLIPTGLGVGAASQMQGQESNDGYKKGGIVAELPEKEIDKLIKQGYIIEEVSEHSLTKASYGHSVGNLIRKDDGGSVSGTQGLTADFSQRLTQMILDAKAQGIDLGVGSGYRSYEKQKRLWEQALKKYGSPEKARKWVAPPGGSFHNKGLAVDLNANGQFLGKDANSKATEWAHANAKKYGLHFRMGHEPWHIEPIEKTKSSSDKEDEHDHDDEAGIFGDQPKPTTQEEYEKMIQDKNLEFELKQKELAERERRLHDDDYSNWKPSKKEVVDPKQQILDQYSKIIAPSSQNVFEQYNANLQGQMKDGGFIMKLTEKEIDRYRKGGFIIEELD